MYSRLKFNPCWVSNLFSSRLEKNIFRVENILRLQAPLIIPVSWFCDSFRPLSWSQVLLYHPPAFEQRAEYFYSHATFVIGWIDIKLVFTASEKNKNFFNCGSALALLAVLLFCNWIARFQLISSSWIRNNELIRGGFEMVKSARSVRDWDKRRSKVVGFERHRIEQKWNFELSKYVVNFKAMSANV